MIQQLRNRFRVLKHRRNSEMSPFLCLACTRSFRPLHPLFCIHTEDQPHRQFTAICQLHNYVGDLPRIAFRTPFEALQQLKY
jgi:hypothetical protein